MISKTSIELDEEGLDLLETYEVSTAPDPIASREELEQFREYARATSIKDRRVNIRLNSSDLHDIQARALREGMPYQTLIASVLHKYVTGRLKEV
ncbi:hypothetical protein [Lautropia mirabilis]|jgi:hypothetical protein|nr:MAG: hypothetical protein D8H96_19210 [Lautropia sp.]